MIILLKVFHIIVGILLILVVLLQFGRGSEIGAVFGGTSTQAIFGTSAPTILEKITIVLAAIFMFTAGILSYVATKHYSVFDRVPVERKVVPENIPETFPQEPSAPEK